MKRNSFFIQIFALATLVAIYAGTASAEVRLQRVSQGNNVGMGFMCDWCCPWTAAGWTGNTIQFPKGSGNLILNDAWTVGMMTTRDLNIDGVPEDTIVMGSGGRDNMPYYCSIYARSILETLVAGGEDLESAASARGGKGINRVWSSSDADELAEWPIEGRWPISSTGEPVLHGAETIFEHTGDVFNSWSGPTNGFYMGWACYFLDFRESDNMVYTHIQIHNVTEYMKWNNTYKDRCAAVPDGWKWWGMILFNNWRQMGFGTSSSLGWAYHPAKEINTLWCRSPRVSNWTPQEPPLLGMKVLAYPSLRGQKAGLINIHTVAGAEFGFSSTNNLLAMGLSQPKVYRAVVNKQGLYAGLTNPFTGKPMNDGYPGILTPDDARYNQWIWGGSSNWNHYTFWGELHDVLPRDTVSIDFVIMFSPTGVTPLVAPTYDIANIDDPMMQTAFAPQEQYAAEAQMTYNSGYLTPETPIAPPLTIVPGDHQVTITWSEVNLTRPDGYYSFLQTHTEKDTQRLYRQYDFEGYRVYRSTSGRLEEAKLVAQFDLANGIVLATGITPAGDTLGISKYDRSGGSPFGLGRDTGLSYTFVDHDVLNGIPYYYMVTAYDWNSLSDSSSDTSFCRESRLVFLKSGRAVPKSAAGTGYTLSGDVNTDGQVDLFDILTIVRFALGEKTPTTEERTLADLNSDGKIDILDVLACVDKALGRTLQLAAYSQTDIAQIDRAQLTSNLVPIGADQQLIENVFRLLDQYQSMISLPKAFSLGQNSPNPFNPSTTISYSVPEGQTVQAILKVYDLRGRLVRTLVEEMLEPGSYSVFWDGRDGSGQQISSGVYLYRMRAGEFTQTRKMVLLK